MMDKRKLDGAVDESSTEQQLYVSCKKSGVLHQVELGLMLGRLASWLADKIQMKFDF